MKQKNYTKIILLISAILLCLILLFYFMRVHNGVKVAPSMEYPVKESTVMYRQDDEKWAKDTLGESSYHMKGSGCLVSCIAAAVSNGGETITPGELNAFFSENGVYDKEGNIQWGKISEMEGYQVEVFNNPSNESIEQCLQNGNYPIVRIRVHKIGNYHYVLVVGTKQGDYICMDPLEDELTTLSSYGKRVYTVRCVWKE